MLALFAVGFACSSAATPAGEGADCFQATDCADGLICLPASCNNGRSICSSDLTCVQTQIDAGSPDATVANPDGGAPKDGATGDGLATDTGGSDTNPPADAGADTGVDSGSGQDTGSVQDTGGGQDTGPVTDAALD